MSIMITTKEGIEYAQLAAMKGAVKLEKAGLKHSSGRSLRKHAAVTMGLKPGASYDDVIKALEAKMNELLVKKAQQQAEGATKQ